MNNDENGEIIEKYKRFYADINGERHIKTCPQCSAIKEFDKKLFEGIQWKKTVPRRVVCDECQYVWCFFCHAPWHENMTCKEYQEGEKLVQIWAQKKDTNQQNAQRCPRCKVSFLIFVNEFNSIDSVLRYLYQETVDVLI